MIPQNSDSTAFNDIQMLAQQFQVLIGKEDGCDTGCEANSDSDSKTPVE